MNRGERKRNIQQQWRLQRTKYISFYINKATTTEESIWNWNNDVSIFLLSFCFCCLCAKWKWKWILISFLLFHDHSHCTPYCPHHFHIVLSSHFEFRLKWLSQSNKSSSVPLSLGHPFLFSFLFSFFILSYCFFLYTRDSKALFYWK